MRFLLIAGFLLLCSSRPLLCHGQFVAARKARARSGSKANADADAALVAANQGVATLKELINSSNYKQFGLDSLDQVQKLQLGTGVPLFYVRADQLKSYVPGTD